MNTLRGVTAGLRPWTAEEDAILRRWYEKRGGPKKCRSLLPGRSEQAVWHHARALGLATHCPVWTPVDDARLRDLWETGTTLGAIARMLGRPHRGVYHRAQEIGLQLGVPPGFEYFTHAAKRTGYCTATLRKILKWGGVKLRPALARPTTRRTAQRMYFVEPFDVDDAIERWLKTEPLTSAARRLGRCPETLRRRAHELGMVPKAKAPKVHIRLTEAQVAKLVASVPKVGRRPDAPRIHGRWACEPARSAA